jgi:hypothetical protein
VVVFLQNANKTNHLKIVLIVLGMNAVVGKVFTLDKKKIVYLIKLKKIDFVIIPLVALIDSV